MCKSDEGNLDGEFSYKGERIKSGEESTRESNAAPSEVQVKRCSVQVHLGDPTKYYVQRTKFLDYSCTDWYTVKRYMSLTDAMRYIYDRTGER